MVSGGGEARRGLTTTTNHQGVVVAGPPMLTVEHTAQGVRTSHPFLVNPFIFPARHWQGQHSGWPWLLQETS